MSRISNPSILTCMLLTVGMQHLSWERIKRCRPTLLTSWVSPCINIGDYTLHVMANTHTPARIYWQSPVDGLTVEGWEILTYGSTLVPSKLISLSDWHIMSSHLRLCLVCLFWKYCFLFYFVLTLVSVLKILLPVFQALWFSPPQRSHLRLVIPWLCKHITGVLSLSLPVCCGFPCVASFQPFLLSKSPWVYDHSLFLTVAFCLFPFGLFALDIVITEYRPRTVLNST